MAFTTHSKQPTHFKTVLGLALACGAMTSLLVASPALAQGAMTVSPSSIAPGGTVTISGSVPVTGAASCPAGDPAQLTSIADLFPPDGFGPQAPRDATGAFRTGYTVPPTTKPGTYTIVVRCGGANTGIAANLRIIEATSNTTAPAPVKGKRSSRFGWIAFAAAGAVIVLAAATLVVRRRRS